MQRLSWVHGFSAVLVTHEVQEALVLADRVLVIEEGQIAHDMRVNLSRPRGRADAAFGTLERELPGRVLARSASTNQFCSVE